MYQQLNQKSYLEKVVEVVERNVAEAVKEIKSVDLPFPEVELSANQKEVKPEVF